MIWGTDNCVAALGGATSPHSCESDPISKPMPNDRPSEGLHIMAI